VGLGLHADDVVTLDVALDDDAAEEEEAAPCVLAAVPRRRRRAATKGCVDLERLATTTVPGASVDVWGEATTGASASAWSGWDFVCEDESLLRQLLGAADGALRQLLRRGAAARMRLLHVSDLAALARSPTAHLAARVIRVQWEMPSAGDADAWAALADATRAAIRLADALPALRAPRKLADRLRNARVALHRTLRAAAADGAGAEGGEQQAAAAAAGGDGAPRSATAKLAQIMAERERAVRDLAGPERDRVLEDLKLRERRVQRRAQKRMVIRA
jgi:hypothetical protein